MMCTIVYVYDKHHKKMSALRIKNTSESDPLAVTCTYEVT